MKTRPYEPFSFGHCANIDRFGLIKVNRRNYEALKDSANPQVYYNASMGVLMIDKNVVMLDDELADDVAMYQPNFTAKTAEEITLFKSKENLAPPPIRPIEVVRLFDTVL